MSESQLATVPESSSSLSLGVGSFDHIQRVAKLFAESQLVPTTFQKNIANVTVALEMSSRIGCSPLMVMQNLNIIHGKPSFGASFMIATVNACGRFTPLRFIFVGTEGRDDWGCYAIAKAKVDGFECKGVTITMEMAKAEGWLTKSGSKWKTMPQLMLQYRAATFWTRAFAPEILMGFPTQDEIVDVEVAPTTEIVQPPAAEPAEQTAPRRRAAKGVNAMKAAEPVAAPATVETPPPPVTEKPKDTTTPAPAPENSPVSSSSEAAQPAEPASAASTTEPSAPAEGEKSEPTPAPETADMLPRCEIKGVTTRGTVLEVKLEGDYTGLAYYRTVAGKTFPAVGALIDVTLIDQPSKVDPQKSVKVITAFEVIA